VVDGRLAGGDGEELERDVPDGLILLGLGGEGAAGQREARRKGAKEGRTVGSPVERKRF
jgi:hypothetical protein